MGLGFKVLGLSSTSRGALGPLATELDLADNDELEDLELFLPPLLPNSELGGPSLQGVQRYRILGLGLGFRV